MVNPARAGWFMAGGYSPKWMLIQRNDNRKVLNRVYIGFTQFKINKL
jgi:hypothetical protein